jgi:hypothetical protein
MRLAVADFSTYDTEATGLHSALVPEQEVFEIAAKQVLFSQRTQKYHQKFL